MTFETQDLVVRYGRVQRPALDGVSMRVSEGTLYAVLGPNGSGKSSLMRALLGVLTPFTGEARVAGTRISAWTRRALAREVGAVAQSEQLAFPMSVKDFVGMGRYPHLGPLRPPGEHDKRAVEESLRRCDVLDLARRDILTLSGGELQRVRIARALSQEPNGLILDEPTASLDVRHEMSIFKLLREAADRGMTVLLITHHMNLAARFADRYLLLDQGKVAAEGTADEVFREEILRRVYRWPLAVRADSLTRAPRVTPLDGGPQEPSR